MYTTYRPSRDQSVAMLLMPLCMSLRFSEPLARLFWKRFGGKPSRGEEKNRLATPTAPCPIRGGLRPLCVRWEKYVAREMVPRAQALPVASHLAGSRPIESGWIAFPDNRKAHHYARQKTYNHLHSPIPLYLQCESARLKAVIA